MGRRLAATLREDGARVIGLSRDPAAARRAVPALADARRWDGDSAAPAPGALDGLDAIVHLAGEPVSGRWNDAKKRRIEDSRVRGTAKLIDALAEASPRPKVLVSASAMGYYGDRGEEELTEDAPPADDFLARVCVGWEREARRAEVLGVRVVSLRIGLVLGDGGALGEMLPLYRAGLGGPMGSGRQHWPWIHIDDLVGVIRFALGNDALFGPVNAVAPGVVRQREFSKILGRVLGRPSLMPTPVFALRAALGGFAAELVGSRRLVPRRLLDAGYPFAHPELEGALTDLLRAPG